MLNIHYSFFNSVTKVFIESEGKLQDDSAQKSPALAGER
ncbi:hypothetical protein MY9_1933 [Bacillus sp. JS]|nr:hypothetical protein MY9_1933 [Bacillus sp. JS]